MKRSALLLLGLFLAACAPAYYPTPGDGVLLPEQIQRAADAYTATARAGATQAAQATATDQSSRATATTARQATLDALAARQTDVALSLTQAAGLAAATDVAGAKTQAVRETAAWATPTAAAVRTQAAVSAAETASAQARAQDVAQFWQTIRFIAAFLLVVGGLTAIAIVAIDRVSRVRVAVLREKAAIAREAFKMLPPRHWAEWQAGEGYQVYQLPGGLDEPAVIVENENSQVDHDHNWKVSVLQSIMYATQVGWTFDALGPTGINVMDRPDWDQLTDYLRDCALVGKRDRSRTRWAADVTPESARETVRRGLPLPFPATSAPRVHSPRCTEAQLTLLAQKHRMREPARAAIQT